MKKSIIPVMRGNDFGSQFLANLLASVENMYELMIILKPLLPDDVRKAIHKTIVTTIADMGGEVKDVDVWGKRYLSYKIKGYSEGYYIVYQFDLAAANVAEFSRQMGLKQEVIRFFIDTQENPELIHKSLKKKEIEI